MPVNKNDVEHIARLARLKLTEDEAALYSRQMDSILHWIEQLNEADVSGVPGTDHVLGSENVMRDDVASECGCREAILANAPARQFDFVKVKKVIE